jgi:flagellin-like hook-associated protein FlgL
MSFGIGDISYTELYDTARTISNSGGPNHGGSFNLKHMPSESVLGPTEAKGSAAADFASGKTYEITALVALADGEKDIVLRDTDITSNDDIKVGTVFTVTNTSNMATITGDDITVREIDPSLLTTDIEAVQAKINTARVQAGSQYAALESAVAYTTDLTAQYELGYNTVNDVNFSMETAHLAKNQILQ